MPVVCLDWKRIMKEETGNKFFFCSTAKKCRWSRCFPFYSKYKLSPRNIGADNSDNYLTIPMSNEIKTLWIDHVYIDWGPPHSIYAIDFSKV